MYKKFNEQHNLTSYLCEDHFSTIMTRDTHVAMPDNRFKNI